MNKKNNQKTSRLQHIDVETYAKLQGHVVNSVYLGRQKGDGITVTALPLPREYTEGMFLRVIQHARMYPGYVVTLKS